MIYQKRFETKLFQLFAHSENSEWFSIISVVTFDVNIVSEQKQVQLGTIFLFLCVKIALKTSLLPPMRCRCSGVPVFQSFFVLLPKITRSGVNHVTISSIGCAPHNKSYRSLVLKNVRITGI